MDDNSRLPSGEPAASVRTRVYPRPAFFRTSRTRFMKPVLSTLLALGFILPGTSTLRADEPPELQLEFARKLRAKKMSDLALQHLEKLRKNAPPALAFQLPLEIARSRVSLAREKEPDQRAALFGEARAELQAFVQKHPDRPEATQARVEIARLAAYEGQALLSQALRQEDTKAQIDIGLRAEEQFLQAGRELEASVKLLDELCTKYQNAATEPDKELKKQYNLERIQVRFDRGLNYLDQARSYLNLEDDKANRKRAEVIVKARDAFKEVINEDDQNPVCHLARAWLIRCYQEGQDPQQAEFFYKRVMSFSGRVVLP